MKRLIVFTLVVIGMLFTTNDAYGAFAEQPITQDDALTIAKREFSGQDVDYYVLNDNNTNAWTIFVDAEPMKGWTHQCYLLTMPKSSLFKLEFVPVEKVSRDIPPEGDLEPLLVKNRYSTNGSMKPVVATSAYGASEAAKRTYALIISGGIKPTSNHERYWNDCSFIYQTLVKRYHVPKNHIYPIMSDGTNPAADMLRYDGSGYISQPLDLDNDGVADIKLAATKSNIKNTLASLSSIIQEDDQLFIFVIDHGGHLGNNSFICLWNNEALFDYELAQYLQPFAAKYANINVVLGQCYSGGFIDDLQNVNGCVVATASSASESSWACADIPYDEFVYQWTCAVNGANHQGYPVDVILNLESRRTMLEIFNHAKLHDRRTYEHPQYISVPESVGEDLAFNHLAPAIDLYLKDNEVDTGIEPNRTTDNSWISPSLWIRNEDDSIAEHENPIYSSTHPYAFVNACIYNRGKKDYVGGKWLQIYWANASTQITAKVWRGRETYNNSNVTGGPLEPWGIDSISSGESRNMSIQWSLPGLLKNYPDGNFHFCILGVILDGPYDEAYVPGVTVYDVLGSNDVSQKNITIIKQKDSNKDFLAYVRNGSNSGKSYTLELIPETNADVDLFKYAKVDMTISGKVYEAWVRGGSQSHNVETTNDITEDNKKVLTFVSQDSRLEAVNFNAEEFDFVSIKFKFFMTPLYSKTYTYDLIQKDEDGNIIGGERFIVESPSKSSGGIIINPDPGIIVNSVNLSVDGDGFKSIEWFNGQGETIGTGESVTVQPTADNNKFSVFALTECGEAASDSITLEPINAIESIDIDSCNLTVLLKSNAPAKASISVNSALDGSILISGDIEEGTSSVTLNTMGSSGLFIVSYKIGEEVVGQRKISIN